MILAWAAGIAAVLLAALVDVIGRARRLGRQRALGDLAALTWEAYEEVVADAFRRQGYRVQEVGGRGTADGGVDLVLTRESATTVAQVKHWRRDRIGVQLVRELYGVQRARGATHAAFVVLSSYTTAARAFADQVGMTLIDGEELLRIISAGLEGEQLVVPSAYAAVSPVCPACGGEMVRRTARRGPHAGEQFLGCARFPACRGTVAMPGEVASVP